MKNFIIVFLSVLFVSYTIFLFTIVNSQQTKTEPISATFDQAAKEFQVPKELLETICYMEGGMSNHNGYPSVANGYGCMHLMKNDRADTLDEAASLLHVNTKQLETDMPTNIRGGAAVLRKEVLQFTRGHTLPKSLADWYGAVAAYSHATTKQSATMYADAVYDIINKGFVSTSDTGEMISLKPHPIAPNKTNAELVDPKQSLPQGCVADGQIDYPGAIDCILNPSNYSCDLLPPNNPCTYDEAKRTNDYPISFVAIHYFEAYLPAAFALFRDPKNLVSTHYIVDTDGTVYQMLSEKDIAYHLGNYWYNQRSIGIEHTGFGPTGFRWFNAAEYLGSAKLTAYLLKKYTIPLDHDHIVSHGIVPAGTLDSSPNHVDPDQYWSWDTYFNLIHHQNISYPKGEFANNIVSIHPQTNSLFFAPNGNEYPSDDNFFYLYTNSGTKYPRIPSAAFITDRIDETSNVEADINYVYLNKISDPAGSGENVYQIWYGENDNGKQTDPLFPLIGVINAENGPSNWFAHARLAWLAVPPGDVQEGRETIVKFTSQNIKTLPIYSMPVSDKKYIIGDAPNGSVFISAFNETENETQTLWYEINYNHRQAWVPASDISLL